MKNDRAKHQAWQDRSRAKAMARQREAKPKRLAARSPKREQGMVERRKLVARLLAEYPKCQARVLCRGAAAVDVHERLTRARGGNILDPVQAHMMTACRDCHNWITTHPADAERARLMLPSWHRCPDIGPC